MQSIVFLPVVVLLVAVSSVQASGLVRAERNLAAMFSRNLVPAVDILRCFEVAEHRIGEHIHEILTGKTLSLRSPTEHLFEFRLTDDGLQQRYSDGDWHEVDSEAYRIMLAVAPEERWRMFEAARRIVGGSGVTQESLMDTTMQSFTAAELVVDEVRSAIARLAEHDNLMIVDGLGLTGKLANFLNQAKNQEIASIFYQLLTQVTGKIQDGFYGEQALSEIDSAAVSVDQHLALHASKIADSRFVYFMIDSRVQPQQIIFSGLHKIGNPHNLNIIAMVRKRVINWQRENLIQLKYPYPELIETIESSYDEEAQSVEILLRTLDLARNIAADPELVAFKKLLVEDTVSFNALVDNYIDLVEELYFIFFKKDGYADLLVETSNLFEETINDQIVVLDDYSALMSFLQMRPPRVVKGMSYARDLLYIHYHKLKDMINTHLIDDLAQSAQLIEDNSTILTENPIVIETLTNMEIDISKSSKALAYLLNNWQAEFVRVKEQYASFRQQFSNYVSNKAQRAQLALMKKKVKLIADRREGWTVIGNDRKIIVTAQFADFYQRNGEKLTTFDLEKIARASGGITQEMLQHIMEFNYDQFSVANMPDVEKMNNFAELLGNPYEIKLVGDYYIKKSGGDIVLNGIKKHYDVPQDAQPVYQLTYRTYRIYVQAVEVDDRLYLALISGFHKKSMFSELLKKEQINRQSEAILDAINILAKIKNSEEQVIAEFELEREARQQLL